MAEGDFPKSDGDILFASEINKIKSETKSFATLNKIRQQQDRSVDTSNNNDDIFSDAYIDSTGRENTVNTGNTTASFISTGLYYENDNATTSATTESNYDSRTGNNNGNTVSQFFTANADIIVNEVKYNIINTNGYTANMDVDIRISGTSIASKQGNASSNGLKTVTFALSDYSSYITAGTVFEVKVERTSSADQDIGIISTPQTFSGTLYSNYTSSGKAITDGGGIEVTKMVGSTSTATVVEHTIPSGTFSSTVDNLTGKAMIEATETGATIEHRLENATEDSGWILDGNLGGFTAFTSEPTKYIVRLTSKSTGTPSAGYPRIKGAGVFSE